MTDLDDRIHSLLRQVAEAGRDGKDPEHLPPIYENVLRNMLTDEVDNYSDFLTDRDEYLEYAYQRKKVLEQPS